VFYRTMGMLNICFAVANLPELTKANAGNTYPLIEYIRDQYRAITGEELPVPHEEGVPASVLLDKALRKLGIPLWPIERAGFEEQEELLMSHQALLKNA